MVDANENTTDLVALYMQIETLRTMREDAYKPWHAASMRYHANERPSTRAKRADLAAAYQAVVAMEAAALEAFKLESGMDVYAYEAKYVLPVRGEVRWSKCA